jgi:hypothetical protein
MESGVKAAREAAAGAAAGDGAVERAVAEAVSGLDGPPAVVLTFPSGIPPSELSAAMGSLNGVPVAGMTGNGSIGPEGAVETGCTAVALGGLTQVGVGVARQAGTNLRAAAAGAAGEALGAVTPAAGRTALVLLLDTRTGDQSDAIAGAYAVAGPEIPLAGGAAGGPEPMQLADGEALERSVVAVALVRPGPVGVGTAHGCRPVGAPAIVTRSQERRVLELNGSPAVAAYLEGIGFAGAELSDREFEILAVTHPLAQPELSGDERVRHILGREGEALVCATHIPENAAVFFTSETPADVVGTAGQAVSESVAGLDGAPPSAAILFDCAGRKAAAAGSITHEVSALLRAFGPRRPPLAGLFTHGEVARIRGAKGDRNHAIVALTLA